jgi:hypothetical protein
VAVDRMYRQGDVLLVAVGGVPAGASPVGRRGGRLVLAYGEATGHAHTIDSDDAALFDGGPTERPVVSRGDSSNSFILAVRPEAARSVYLDVRGVEPVLLRHQEHDSILVDPGTYRVVRQREYAPRAAPRPVAD